ncbi:Voltage-dependent anion-selective channel protein 1 [Melipona quadrifasciata]|uniref:Voltage-dependent anion-selective channel protein 1 n=1 Tax=Melipona quadrifasciata TaxID=166423 RepID=A0A0N1IU67_9HYME|nr:Voltage-dependent anion-selective channel protein 1 [Melipona quadrifasciata]
MSVPSFTDLGKNARDVFRSGYHYGKSLIKLGIKSKSSERLAMGSDLRLNCDTSKLTGVADAEYKTEDYGSFLQKWTTDGTITLGYGVRQTIITDVGLKSEISYNPETAAKIIKVGANVTKQAVNAKEIFTNLPPRASEISINFLVRKVWLKACFPRCIMSASDANSNVDILGSIVTTVKGLLIGYQGGYNTETNKMTKNDLGLAFSYQDIYQEENKRSPALAGNNPGLTSVLNPEWDAAINGILARNGGVQQWTLGAAAKCNIDEGSTFRCKFNTDLQFGLSLQQKLDANVMLTLSFNIDCANVTRGGHKVGLALEIKSKARKPQVGIKNFGVFNFILRRIKMIFKKN